MIENLIHPENDRVLADSGRSVPYAQLGTLFAELDALLSRHDVGRHDCIAVAGRNGVLAAAAVLYLLARGRHCLLWRGPIAIVADEFDAGELPPFCDFALIAESSYRLATRRGGRVAAGIASDPFVYVCTSGTTGIPKIAVYTREKLLRNAGNCMERLRLSPEDRVVIPVPIAHMYGLGAAFLPAVLAGASVYVLDGANLLTFLRAEEEFDPNVAFLTPSFAHLLVTGRRRPRPYRLTVLAGDRVDDDTFSSYEQRHGCTVNLYGSTELGAVSAGDPADPLPLRMQTAGRPMTGVQPFVPDPVQALAFVHPCACEGYANDLGMPEMPEELYCDGLYRTRDLGRVDRDGYLTLLGRVDHCVKRDGFLVAFADVERALLRLEGIARAVVIPGEMTPRGRALVAFCAGASRPAPDPRAFRTECLGVLPAYAVPDRFVFLAEIPLTATGKPDRKALELILAPPSESSPS